MGRTVCFPGRLVCRDLNLHFERSSSHEVNRTNPLDEKNELSLSVSDNPISDGMNTFDMMIEVITFKLPDDMAHEKLLENYKETTAKWRENSS